MSERKGHPVITFGAGAAAAALLLFGRSGGFGLGGGEGAIGMAKPESAPAATPVAEVQVTEQPAIELPDAVIAEDEGLHIAVREKEILWNGETVTATELEEKLLADWSEGVEVELRDEGAILSAYEEVTLLLNRLGIPYTQGE